MNTDKKEWEYLHEPNGKQSPEGASCACVSAVVERMAAAP